MALLNRLYSLSMFESVDLRCLRLLRSSRASPRRTTAAPTVFPRNAKPQAVHLRDLARVSHPFQTLWFKGATQTLWIKRFRDVHAGHVVLISSLSEDICRGMQMLNVAKRHNHSEASE